MHLTRVLELSEDKVLIIYTHSKYVFSVIHAHGAIWRVGALLKSENGEIKYGKEIHRLLAAIHKPQELAMAHRRGHQKGNSEVTEANNLADAVTKWSAKYGEIVQVPLIPSLRTHPTSRMKQKSLQNWPINGHC